MYNKNFISELDFTVELNSPEVVVGHLPAGWLSTVHPMAIGSQLNKPTSNK